MPTYSVSDIADSPPAPRTYSVDDIAPTQPATQPPQRSAAQPVADVQQQPVAPPPPQPATGLMHPDDVAAKVDGVTRAMAQTITAEPDTILHRLSQVFTGPGSLYGNVDAQRTGAQAPYNPDAPLVDFSANAPKVAGPAAVRGFTKAVQDGLGGLTTPKNAALLIGTYGLGSIPVIGRLITAGFAGDMLYTAGKQSPQLVAQIRSGDTEGAAKTATSMGLNVGLAGLAAFHAAKPGTREAKASAPAPVEYSSTGQPIRTPAPEPVARTYSVADIAPEKPAAQPAQRAAAEVPEPREQTPKPAQSTIEQPGATDGTAGKQPATTVDAGAARPLDAGGTGEGAAVHGTTPPGPRRFIGKATRVLIPGESRSIPAHYEARELDDINASHLPETFAPNPRYKLKNERDYSKAENQQRLVEQSSEENFEPRYHINNNPDMANGPPLLFDEDEGPDTIGGNSRLIAAQRVFARGGRKAQAYREQFAEEAAHYGLDPQAVRGMHKGYLVRVADRGAMDDIPGGAKWAIRKTNVQGQAALSSSERAAADAGQMSPLMMSHIAGAIEDAGPDATLNDALTGKSGTAIVNRLIADGFFSEQERPALMDGKTGVLTQAAKDRISKALLGKFFRDSDQIARTPASIKNKLERVAAPLAKVAGNPEWDITPEVRDAIDLTEYANAHGIKNFDDVVSQTSMFGEAPKWSDGAVRLAGLLRDGKPNDVVAAFRKYVNSKEPTMFGESTPAEAFRDAFGAEKPPGAAVPERNLDGSGSPVSGAGEPTSPPPVGASSSLPDKPPDKPAASTGPTYLGSGLGAFEPFLRESYEDTKALIAQRAAAKEQLERSKITPGEKNWGDQVRHYFTGERDLWAARANQGIAKVRKLLGVAKDRRGVDTNAVVATIARQFKGSAPELRAFLDGSHPDLTDIEDPEQYKRVMDRIQSLRPAIERVLAGAIDTPGQKAVDRFYTNMAAMTAAEGKRTGVLHTEWDNETYVPQLLHPRGEGLVSTARESAGKAMGGKIGKYFGFAQRRQYPTLLHAIADDRIPKTMDIHAAFTMQQDMFATARATRLLEAELKDSGVGVYAVAGKEPEDWVPFAPQSPEFREIFSYPTGTIDEEGRPVTEHGERRLYTKKFIAEGMEPVTAPDFAGSIWGFETVRTTQALTKAAQLGMSLFHAKAMNLMAVANMGPKGYAKALLADRDSPLQSAGERTFIAHGGITSILRRTIEAYQAMQPGAIPTYQDIWRANTAVKALDQTALAISEFTFDNMQRRFKVTDFMLRDTAWRRRNPLASPGQLRIARQSIAKEVNAIYGGLHWENIGVNKVTVGVARAIMLAPDWTISNIFNLKYAFERNTEAGRMTRMFWMRTLVGGLIATQLTSLMFTGKLSPRLTRVYRGRDRDGFDRFDNMYFSGAAGDADSLITNVDKYGAVSGLLETTAGKGGPLARTGIQMYRNRDRIAPRGMSPLASTARGLATAAKSLAPVPWSAMSEADMLWGPEKRKYGIGDYMMAILNGRQSQHATPPGTREVNGVLHPVSPREVNSVLDQAETGEVYKRGAR